MQINNQKRDLLLSSCIPALVMLTYFIYRGFAPFGSSSLLTVDMGQQYVAFYEYFRQTILGHPGQLFYSFSNGLGSDMFGTWAYYLLSPTNLILLFFKKESITTGILIVTLVKYALAGLTAALYLHHLARSLGRNPNRLSVAGFATSYSLMAFSIANQLNLFWLDAPILLPLIIMGIDQIIADRKLKLFVISMTAMVIINYYFAYMIGIFTVMYFLWRSPRLNWRKAWSFVQAWLAVGIFSAVTWMPTLWALLHGKANYTENALQWKFEYNPLKMVLKLFPGTFSFKQMSEGLPNIYVGMVILIAVIAYFFNRQIKLSQRLSALAITAIFLLSFCWSPLDLLWHAMQFPWWYAYRFSFIFSFWMMMLAFWGMLYPLQNKLLAPLVTSLLGLCLILLAGIQFLQKSQDFLSNDQLILGGILFIAALLLWVGLQSTNSNPALRSIMLGLMVLDVGINAVWSLNRISYVSQSEFQTYSVAARKALRQIQKHPADFQRIGTNYFRAKNDPIQLGFNSGASFNSNLETNSLEAMADLGQPTTSGNITYMNGTLLSDAFLDFRSWSLVDAQPKKNPFLTRSVRHDILQRYDYFDKTRYANNYRNPYAISLGAMTSQPVTNQLPAYRPLEYQNTIMTALGGQSKVNLFDDLTSTAQIYYSNVSTSADVRNAVLNKQKLNKGASVTFEVVPQTDDPLYITAGSQMNYHNADIFVNNQRITEDIDYDHPIVLSVADHSRGKRVRIQIVLKKSTLLVSDFGIYQLDFAKFKQLDHVAQNNQLTDVQANGNVVTGKLKATTKRPYLFTSIPYSPGWHLKVDGHAVATQKVANHFLGSADKISSGTHQWKLTYYPPLLGMGTIITLLGWLGLLIKLWWQKSRRK